MRDGSWEERMAREKSRAVLWREAVLLQAAPADVVESRETSASRCRTR
jgi:hypothetical protein